MTYLRDLQIGDKVHLHYQEESGSYKTELNIITDIDKRRDRITNEDYTIISINPLQRFDSRDGTAVSPPLSYYITPIV